MHHEADVNSMNSCLLIVSTAYKCQTNDIINDVLDDINKYQ